MIPLIWDVQNRQIYRRICGCLSPGDHCGGESDGWGVMAKVFQFGGEVMKMF